MCTRVRLQEDSAPKIPKENEDELIMGNYRCLGHYASKLLQMQRAFLAPRRPRRT